MTKYDRSSLRKLGSVGEPINQEAWNWFFSVIGEGRCDLIDTWWQTETGGVALAPRPSAPNAPLAASKPQRPMFGMNPVLLDEKGKVLSGKRKRIKKKEFKRLQLVGWTTIIRIITFIIRFSNI